MRSCPAACYRRASQHSFSSWRWRARPKMSSRGCAADGADWRLIGPKRTQIIFWATCKCLERMAGTTRLELATSAVTGQRSNQLNYVPAGIAVTGMVGSAGPEPATSCL